jgi:hypothetical protein
MFPLPIMEKEESFTVFDSRFKAIPQRKIGYTMRPVQMVLEESGKSR